MSDSEADAEEQIVLATVSKWTPLSGVDVEALARKVNLSQYPKSLTLSSDEQAALTNVCTVRHICACLVISAQR